MGLPRRRAQAAASALLHAAQASRAATGPGGAGVRCQRRACPATCAGRDLHSNLQRTACSSAAGPRRLFGWGRRGARVALEVARALNYVHHKVRLAARAAGPGGGGTCPATHVTHLLPRGPLPCTRAHQGYVHGDIKSSNVLLTAGGAAKLADIAFSRRYLPLRAGQERDDSFAFEPPPLSGTFAW